MQRNFFYSFANSILPFLAEDYEKLVVVDLRQLNVSGDRLLEMFSPTDILILTVCGKFCNCLSNAGYPKQQP